MPLHFSDMPLLYWVKLAIVGGGLLLMCWLAYKGIIPKHWSN